MFSTFFQLFVQIAEFFVTVFSVCAKQRKIMRKSAKVWLFCLLTWRVADAFVQFAQFGIFKLKRFVQIAY